MRIAIYSDTFFPQINGVANVAYQSAVFLSEAGHDVLVCAPAIALHKVDPAWKFKVVTLPSLPTWIYRGERAVLPFGLGVWRALRTFKPEIIHSHTPFGAGWAAVAAARWWKVPLVGTHHTFFDHYLKHVYLDFSLGRKFSWKYTVWYYNRCSVIVSPSRSLAADLITHGLTRPVQIVHNAVDTDLFHPYTPDQKDVLKKLVYMGRLSYEKDIDEVLEVFAEVRKEMLKKRKSVQLLLIGDGPEREKLEVLARELGVSEHVTFTGMLTGSDLAERLGEADVFVTASKSENMPLSVLEAQATGLPVVCFAEKGLTEIVSDGVDGFLSKAGDILGMRDNILKLLGNATLLKEMSGQARLNAEKYSRDMIRKQLEYIYEKEIKNLPVS